MTLRWTKFIGNDYQGPLYAPHPDLTMKDQNSIDQKECKDQKYNRALDLFTESVHKPDHALRGCAHNQHCYNELMEVREEVLRYIHTLRRTLVEPKPEVVCTIDDEPVNLDECDGPRSYEYAADVTLSDIARFQRGSSL
mgnify:CR=1 FL=1|jgi:hypothetical protein